MRIHKCPCFFFSTSCYVLLTEKQSSVDRMGVRLQRVALYSSQLYQQSSYFTQSTSQPCYFWNKPHEDTSIDFFSRCFFLRQSLRERNNHGIEMSLWLRVLVDKILLLRLYFCGVSSLTNMDISLAAAINELSNTSSEFFFSLEAL